jgi:hypothetical protein
MWILADVPRFVLRVRRRRTVSREVISLRGTLRPLQDQFNAGSRRLRFLAILSPT